LPFARVRTTPGAWLASAIRQEYGPPEGYLRRRAGRRERAPNPGTPDEQRTSPEADSQPQIDARLRDAYGQLEKTRPDAIAAFLAYLGAEQDRARRFAARLSSRRREEYLAVFDTEERRLRVFARWLKTEGQAFVASRTRGEATTPGRGPAVNCPAP
jgi:hypothetical protein